MAIGAGVVALVVGTSGLAAADLYTAHTGRGPADVEDVRLGGPGERLDPAAPDYGEVVAEVTSDIPFPNVQSRQVAVQDQVHDARFDKPGTTRVSVGALRAWVADAALCAWSNRWAVATRHADEAARAEAITVIQGAHAWPAVTAIDPRPYRRIETEQVTGENGQTRTERFWDESQFFYVGALAHAVQGRDLDAVARVLAANNGYCRNALPVELQGIAGPRLGGCIGYAAFMSRSS